jgi:hypothetical protein
MSLTLLFYTLSERFNDDLRLISFFIDEANAEKIYKDLLSGKFDKYAKMLEEKLNQFEGDLNEWIADTLVKLEFSRNKLFVRKDFENIGE